MANLLGGALRFSGGFLRAALASPQRGGQEHNQFSRLPASRRKGLLGEALRPARQEIQETVPKSVAAAQAYAGLGCPTRRDPGCWTRPARQRLDHLASPHERKRRGRASSVRNGTLGGRRRRYDR